MDRQLAPYCLALGATKMGEGTLGKTAKVTGYEAKYENTTEKFYEDIFVLSENTDPSLVVQEVTKGRHYNTTEQREWHWHVHREWFHLKTDAIPSSVFTVPVGCIQPQLSLFDICNSHLE